MSEQEEKSRELTVRRKDEISKDGLAEEKFGPRPEIRPANSGSGCILLIGLAFTSIGLLWMRHWI
jgi:hypothetical protein